MEIENTDFNRKLMGSRLKKMRMFLNLTRDTVYEIGAYDAYEAAMKKMYNV